MEFFLRFIQFVVKIVYVVIYALLKLALPRKKDQSIPPIRNKLLTLSLVQLVQRLRLHQVSGFISFIIDLNINFSLVQSVNK